MAVIESINDYDACKMITSKCCPISLMVALNQAIQKQ